MGKLRKARCTVRRGVRAAKYLWVVRAALPKYLQGLVWLTAVVKVITAPLPLDGGVDEMLMVLTAGLLLARHRPLLRVCWAAAGLEA